MSVGKYRACLLLRELDPDVTVEEIRDMTMQEIYQRIREYEVGGDTAPAPSGGHGHGNHHGRE